MSPRALLLAGGVLTSGCGSAAPPLPAPSVSSALRVSESCLLATDSTSPARDITAAFEDPAAARRSASAAALDAPIRLDCEGRPAPGVAVAWSRDTAGKFWTLQLGEPAVSDSTTRWTAAALAATWRADPEASAALRWAGVESLLPLDARRLVVGLTAPALEVPPLFADRALAVALGGERPAIESGSPTGDLRDAIDRGVDLIQTGDPELLDYARRRGGLESLPLPWSRTYLLVLPDGDSGIGGVVPADTAAFQAGLARDAVRTDARPPETSFWWEQRIACPGPAVSGSARRPQNAVAYAAADPVARGLAERIVALSAPSGTEGVADLTARGLPTASLTAALQVGGARAFVLGVPSHAPVPCRETAGWPEGAVVVPLVETRTHAIVRRGTPRLVAEWDGALRVAAP